jgi:hypothetical protein
VRFFGAQIPMTTRGLAMLLTVFLTFLAFCSAERCQDEEPLPANFLLNSLGDFHMHGEFRTNFLSTNFLNFSITQQSYFRLLLDELAVADVDVYLWRVNAAGNTLVEYSVNYYEAEMIASLLGMGIYVSISAMLLTRLDSGDYAIEFHTYSYETQENLDYICQQIELEVAISPKTLTTQSTKLYLNLSIFIIIQNSFVVLFFFLAYI